ncbi:uncharacterized protein LOC142974331 isoform X2 [Anticarsia gemmatalis]
MLKFGRFKTSFDVYNGKRRKPGKEHDNTNPISINGAYRTNRDEFYIYNNNSESQRKLTPSSRPAPPVPPPIPPEPATGQLRQTKSTSDLVREKNLPPKLRPAQSGVSLDPRGADNNNRDSRTLAIDPKNKRQLDAQKRVEKQRQEEQKKLEKKRLEEQKKLEKQQADEQKKREKLAQQEQAKQAKLEKERQKKEAQQLKKDKKTKRQAPQKPLANPLAQSSSQQASNPLAQGSGTQYNTNTLDSSISKSSGPPPYSEAPNQGSPQTSKNPKPSDPSSNVTFSKPIDTGSWDMISQHRHNVIINRQVNNAPPPPKGKQTTMDLNFSLGEENRKDNSEA